MMGYEFIITEWLIEQRNNPKMDNPYVRADGYGVYTLDGTFNIRELALVLENKQKEMNNESQCIQ